MKARGLAVSFNGKPSCAGTVSGSYLITASLELTNRANASIRPVHAINLHCHMYGLVLHVVLKIVWLVPVEGVKMTLWQLSILENTFSRVYRA